MGLREDYQEKVEAQLTEWAEKLKKLKAAAAEAAAEAGAELQSQVEKLRPQMEAAQAKLKELKAASAEKWESLRDHMDQTMDDLMKTWNRVVQEKESYLAKIEAQINEWSAKIEELKAKADKAGAGAKAEVQSQMEKMWAMLEAARDKLKELEGAGAGKWEKVKESSEKTLDDLKQSWENVKRRFL
jgi:predicted nuclease with TOPRIM domain